MLYKTINRFEEKLGYTKFGALLTMSGKIYNAFIGYVTLVFIARLLSVNDFGVYTFFLSLVTFLVVISSAGSENTLLSIVSKRKEQGHNFFQQTITSILYLVVFFSSIVILLMLISQGVIDEVLNIKNYNEILLIVIWVVFFQSIIIYFRALNQSEFLFFKAVVPENIIRPTILLVLIIQTFIFKTSSLENISINYLLSFFLTAIIVVIWRRNTFRDIKIKDFSFDKETLRLSPQFMTIQLLTEASNFIPVFLIGIFLTSDFIGIFRAAQQTTILVSFILISVNMVFAPTIANLFNKNKLSELKSFYAKTTRWTFILGGYISIIVMLNSKFILGLFGSEYKEWNLLLVILSIGQLINASTGPSGYLLLMTNNQRFMIFFTLIQVFTVFLLAFLTVNLWGIYGIALSVSVGIVTLNVLQLIFVWRKLGIHPLSNQYLGVILTITLSVLIAWFGPINLANQSNFLNSIISSFIFSLIFLIIFLSLGLTKIERNRGLNMAKTIFIKHK